MPTVQDWLKSLIPTNPIAAAANDQVLALVVFTAIFAFAVTRIDADGRQAIGRFFKGIQDAMLVVVGWVLALAPIGVLGLAFAVGAGAGGAAFGAVLHYVVLVSLVGIVVTLVAYVVAITYAGWKLGDFARAMIPPQAVAISTQSSLASLPAMLNAAKQLRVPQRNADVTLPLAVALFRATGPAMNISVAIYVAYWMGVELHAGNLIAGFAVAAVASYWAVSLPGALSFVTSIAPIALAMGVPIEPLALLIAVEVLPDITRTLGNVTWDVAVTGVASRGEREEAWKPVVRRRATTVRPPRHASVEAPAMPVERRMQTSRNRRFCRICGASGGETPDIPTLLRVAPLAKELHHVSDRRSGGGNVWRDSRDTSHRLRICALSRRSGLPGDRPRTPPLSPNSRSGFAAKPPSTVAP